MKESIITEASIEKLVNAFYSKVRKDPTLAPVFIAAVGEGDAQWTPHLKRMYDFWSSIMLASDRYRGNPLKIHKNLPAFDIALFDRWLELFAQTAQELHTPEIAGKFIGRSQRIAESLKLGLYYTPNAFTPVTH